MMKKINSLLVVLLLCGVSVFGQETNTVETVASPLPGLVMPGASVVFESLLQLGPLGLLAALVLAGSYLVRASAINNKIIPWLAAVIGAVSLEFLFPVESLAGKWASPRFVIGIYGFVVAVFVWIVHEFALSRFENWLADKGMFPKKLTASDNSQLITDLTRHEAVLSQGDANCQAAAKDIALAIKKLS